MASKSAESEGAPGVPMSQPAYGAAYPPGPYPQPGMGKDQTQYPQEPPPAYVPPPQGPPQEGQQQYPGAYPPGQQPYPPAQGYNYQQQGGQTTVVLTQPTISLGRNLGLTPYPVARTCPNCHATGVTLVNYTTGGMTWLAAGLLCLFCCWFGCQCIPFCMDSSKDAVHRCSSCHSHIGVYHRL